MTKQITITINDFIYDSAFLNYNGNRSARAEHLLLLGIESETGNIESHKIKIQELNKVLNEITDERNKLKLQFSSLKKKLTKKKNQSNVELMNEAIIDKGLMG